MDARVAPFAPPENEKVEKVPARCAGPSLRPGLGRRPPGGRAGQAADLAGAGRERLGSMGRTMQQLVEPTGSISSELAATREKAGSTTQAVTTTTEVAGQANLLSTN